MIPPEGAVRLAVMPLTRATGRCSLAGWIALKELVAALLVLVFLLSGRSVRRARAALGAAEERDAAVLDLDAAYARTGTWMRVLGVGFLLNFALGLLRPGT